MFRFFFDVLTFYLPPIEDNRRLKKPRSRILPDRSLLQLTEVSDVYRHWPITNFFWFGISGNAFRFQKFVTYALMRTLPYKHRVCECFFLFHKRLYSNACHVLLCVFSLTNIGFVQCLSLGPLLRLYVYLCHVMLCYAYFASQTCMSCHSVLRFVASTRFCFAFHFG